MVDSTADFLNNAQLPPFVRVTENDGFRTKSLLTKHLHAQFVTNSILLNSAEQYNIIANFGTFL